MDQERIAARFSLFSKPRPHQYAGMSYEQASRRAVEICRIAAETGQTINASFHLEECRKVMALTNNARPASQ